MRNLSFLFMLLAICHPALAQNTGKLEKNKQVARSFFEDVLDKGMLDK